MAKYVITDFLNADFPISQQYGDNAAYYHEISGGALVAHEGVDFKTPTGTEIFSPFDGIIVRDTFSGKDYGNFLVVWDPKQNCAVWFCHLQDTAVAQADRVNVGQLLGHTNNTGNSTGPHCHVNFVETDSNGVRLNTGNGYEGFLNIMDPELVQWLPFGGKVAVVSYQPLFKAGDSLLVNSEIPVGQAPGAESLTYGTLSPTKPAKILGILVYNGTPYYNIDQSQIGGGTGFVRAIDVDESTKATQAAQPVLEVPVAPVVMPQAATGEIQTAQVVVTPSDTTTDLVSQRNDALTKLKDMTDKYDAETTNYSGMVALGYSTPDDITKALTAVKDENTGLKKQLVSVLARNQVYHEDMGNKETEDATAIDKGIQAEHTLNEIRSDFASLALMLKTRPTLEEMAKEIDHLKTLYEQAQRTLNKYHMRASLQQAQQTVTKVVQSTTVVRTQTVSFIERVLFGKREVTK